MDTYDNKKGYRRFWKKTVLRYEYQKISGEKPPQWKENKYYTNVPYKVAPRFIPGYYSCTSYEAAPTYVDGKFYKKDTVSGAPEFKLEVIGRPMPKYFSAASIKKVPAFAPKTFFEKFEDKYIGLTEAGIGKLEEIYAKSEEISVDLSPEQEYDINDIVGAKEHITGTSLFQPVTKKIIKIKDRVQTIEYKIGD